MSSVLVINPNSSVDVTDNLKEIMDPAPDFTYKFFTAPSGPDEIDSRTKEISSASICLQALLPILDQHDAFLIACYSDHPLIHSLREHTNKPVLGIFHASVLHALAFSSGSFAIVTTSKVWEEPLSHAVLSFLGTHYNYAGCYSTGLNIHELRSMPDAEVKSRFAAATKKAVENGSKTILLGCAGMAGMEDIVKEIAGPDVRVVDGIVAGAELIVGMVRSTN